MKKVQKHYSEEKQNALHETLKKEFGSNKKFARGYELPALVALSHFPELMDISIEFVFTKSNTPFSSKPVPSSLFVSAKNRNYKVNICKDIKKGREAILPKNLSFNMLVGLIAHEMCHIVDYLNKNSLLAFGTGIFYPVPIYKKKLEKKIDLMTVQHGFGYQLLEFTLLIKKLQQQFPDDKYYRSYFDYYMTPEAIESKIKILQIYNQ